MSADDLRKYRIGLLTLPLAALFTLGGIIFGGFEGAWASSLAALADVEISQRGDIDEPLGVGPFLISVLAYLLVLGSAGLGVAAFDALDLDDEEDEDLWLLPLAFAAAALTLTFGWVVLPVGGLGCLLVSIPAAWGMAALVAGIGTEGSAREAALARNHGLREALAERVQELRFGLSVLEPKPLSPQAGPRAAAAQGEQDETFRRRREQLERDLDAAEQLAERLVVVEAALTLGGLRRAALARRIAGLHRQARRELGRPT